MTQRQFSQNYIPSVKTNYPETYRKQFTGVQDVDRKILKNLDIKSLRDLYLTDKYASNLLDDSELLRFLSNKFLLYPSNSFSELINEYNDKENLVARYLKETPGRPIIGPNKYYETCAKRLYINITFSFSPIWI